MLIDACDDVVHIIRKETSGIEYGAQHLRDGRRAINEEMDE